MENQRIEVKKINFVDEENHFCIFEGITKTKCINPIGKEVIRNTRETFVGTILNPFVGDILEAEGEWVDDDCYGKQFRIETYKRIMPQTIKGIQVFLKNTVRGLGDKKAKALTDALGEYALTKIAEDRDNLNLIFSSEEAKEKAWHVIADNAEFENLLLFMKENGLDYSYAIKIYNVHKNTSMAAIRSNPYSLFFEGAISLKEADRLALSVDGKEKDFQRIKAGIYSLLQKDSKNKGNLYSYKDFILEKVSRELNSTKIFPDVEITEDEKESALENLEDLKYITRTTKLVTKEDIIYIGRNLQNEVGIVENIEKRLREKAKPFTTIEAIEEAIFSYEKCTGYSLDQTQIAAVKMALTNKISILTGLPGTGKTQTMTVILYCINYVKENAIVRLCSPTGKAAKRMSESSGASAQTIHRLAKIYDKAYCLNPRAIDGDFVIVDEASMIDASIFAALLSAINKNTRIVIIGDAEQLPSIGAGSVLKDLIESSKIPTIKLTKIFRQSEGSHILANSHKIIKGEDVDSFYMDGEEGGDFCFMESDSAAETHQKLLEALRKLSEDKRYSLPEIQVLSPISKTVVGTERLNRDIQAILGSHRGIIEINGEEFMCGDKVIHTVNNYDLEVFNGETGIVKETSSLFYNKMVVSMGDKDVDYEGENLKELKLAYAITVHKAQGSEFPVVILPLVKEHLKYLNRSLIYTAFTRAKAKLIVIGSKEVLSAAIKKTENKKRNSQIREMLISGARPI